MKRLNTLVMAAVAAALLSATLPLTSAVAEEAVSFTFDPGNVRFGYADGYWDMDHHWHAWPSAREAVEFKRRFPDRIYGYRHTRYPNDGWHDGAVTISR